MKTRKLILMLLLTLPMSAMGQKHFKSIASANERLSPEGWEQNEVRGDLNGDGISDLVVWATPNDPENMKTRDDGYVYNLNQPVLAIYFATKDGRYKLWKEYDELMPYPMDEFSSIETSMKVTERRTLVMDFGAFYSAGTYNQPKCSYVFRFQNGDFYMIGEENDAFSRNSGEGEKVSINYLTNKQCKTTYNMFDENVKDKSVWSTIPKKPLKRLGSFDLEP